VFLLCIAGVCVISHLVLFTRRYFKASQKLNSSDPEAFPDPQASALVADEEHYQAKELIGNDSVYKYFLGRSSLGWSICLASIGVQLWMGYEFVLSSEYEFEVGSSDLVYTWKCPRDQVDCRNTDGRVNCFVVCPCVCSLG